MNRLLQTPPLKVLGNASVGKIRQHKQEPLVPNLWSKQTRLDMHMHFHFGQLELVLTKWDRLKLWGLEQEPSTNAFRNQANLIVETIQASWSTYDIKDETEVKDYLSKSDIKTLYSRAVRYIFSNDDQFSNDDGNNSTENNIQSHYHRMALLGQILATCDCIVTSLQEANRLPIAHLLAFLYQCLTIQHQPGLADYRGRIEQRFDEIKNELNPTLSQDQLEWVKTLANDIQTNILCNSPNDQHQFIRGCSSVFDVMKQSTARPQHIPLPLPPLSSSPL
ncbi:hypothetical protein BCR42DRAFT_402703 [Absidia repens]|uniref:Uncharacterized protein n=1 Tax=Absidia repens TaxID=90262 RepID=A0A1X2IYG0_9FUNG|nr:hypothetical protein BCR42DRAFT_402703 [Absidia repens]